MLKFNQLPTKKRFYQQYKKLYDCSFDAKHRLTKNQANSNGWMCSHCGAPLVARQQQIDDLNKKAVILNHKINIRGN